MKKKPTIENRRGGDSGEENYRPLGPVRTVHENPWFSVRNRGGYFTVENKEPQVLVLPVVDNRSVMMVKVKRPVIGESTWELPAGGIMEGETSLEAAQRELSEETGLAGLDPARFQALPPLAHSPSRSPQLHSIFLVHLTRQEADARGEHDDEVESVSCVPFHELRERIVSGDIFISLPIAVIARYLWGLGMP